MAEWNFGQLDLTGVETSGAGMTPGRHICRITSAEVKPTKAGTGRMVEITFEDVDVGGSIRDWIVVYMPSSPKAQEIGRGRLKLLLQCAEHPNPNKPEDVKSLLGLTVGVDVVAEKYLKDGVEREGSVVRKTGGPAYFHASGVGWKPPEMMVEVTSLDDEIPF